MDVSQEIIERRGGIESLEDKELKVQVEEAIDWLAHLYKLDDATIENIKKSALVVRSKTNRIRVRQKDFIEEALGYLVTLSQGEVFPVAIEKELENDIFALRKGGMSLSTDPRHIDPRTLLSDILSMSDQFLEIVTEIAEDDLRYSKTSAFRAVSQPHLRHVVVIHPRDGKAGVICEVGHLIFEYLAGTESEKDSWRP